MIDAATVYDWILELPQDALKYFWCILDDEKLFFRRTLVYERGKFIASIKSKLIGETSAKELNRIPLITLAGTENWQTVVASLYDNFKTYVPSYDKKYLNFPCMNKNTFDPFTMRPADDYDRLALELYVLFHKAQNDLTWPDDDRFFIKVSNDCAVYRKWITGSRSLASSYFK